MNLFGVMDISASALQAERVRAEVVAANMANAETTRTAEGGPYRRQHVVFAGGGRRWVCRSLCWRMASPGGSIAAGAGIGAGFGVGVWIWVGGGAGGVEVAGW